MDISHKKSMSYFVFSSSATENNDFLEVVEMYRYDITKIFISCS